MTNPAKTKGTRAETWAERTCHAYGLRARRIDMGQGHGDLEIYPDHDPTTSGIGAYVVVQVKHADDNHYARNKPPLTWLQQAHTQAEKAGAAIGILLVKPDGIAYRNVPDWHAWTALCDLLVLLGVTDSRTPLETWSTPVRVPFGSILTLLGGTPPTGAA